MNAIVQAVMPDADEREEKVARELVYGDRGRLAAIATEAAFYYGFITAILMHSTGGLTVRFTHQGAESSASVKADDTVYLHATVRELTWEEARN